MFMKIPADLDVVAVKDTLEGTVAYAVERDGSPLGLMVKYLDESPAAWWAYARYTRTAKLSAVAPSPFADMQAALDAIDVVITHHPGTSIEA